MFNRIIYKQIVEKIFKGRLVVIYGPRRVGKTTLVKELLKAYPDNSQYYNCEEQIVIDGLSKYNSVELKRFFGDKKLVVLDEAQKIKDIGTKLKLLVDNYPEMQIVATGSSAFELSNLIQESLTGRKWVFNLYPISYQEVLDLQGDIKAKGQLELYLKFGMYPEVLNASQKEATDILAEISIDYLYKDIFNFQDLRNPELLDKLIKMLALQIGSEVSYNELANSLGVNIDTIQRYIKLLEQAFVIFRLTSFSRNLRKEINKSRKIYFWDLGVRNSLIKNHNDLNIRTDSGMLWENFVIAERLKSLGNKGIPVNSYFWRTYQKSEIDYLEETGGKLSAYEIKWSKSKTIKPPKEFMTTYPESEFSLVNSENFEFFVTES